MVDGCVNRMSSFSLLTKALMDGLKQEAERTTVNEKTTLSSEKHICVHSAQSTAG